jgi:hypothetical protein
MATGSTPVRGRPYPLESDAPDVAADMHTLALNLDQVGNVSSGTTLPVSGMVAGDEFHLTTTGAWYKYSGTSWQPFGGFGRDALVPISQGTSVTMAAGNRYLAFPSITLTLPAPVAGLAIGITAATGVSGSSPVTIAYGTGGGGIYGAGLNNAATFVLGTVLASVTLACLDGSNWFITSGQQDTGWVLLTLPVTNVLSFGALPASARLHGDTIRLKGFLKNLTGAPVAANTVIADYPNAWGPSSGLELLTFDPLTSNTAHALQTNVGGNHGAMALAETWATNGGLVLDGVTFSIT